MLDNLEQCVNIVDNKMRILKTNIFMIFIALNNAKC
jgi:hypothetical protein